MLVAETEAQAVVAVEAAEVARRNQVLAPDDGSSFFSASVSSAAAAAAAVAAAAAAAGARDGARDAARDFAAAAAAADAADAADPGDEIRDAVAFEVPWGEANVRERPPSLFAPARGAEVQESAPPPPRSAPAAAPRGRPATRPAPPPAPPRNSALDAPPEEWVGDFSSIFK